MTGQQPRWNVDFLLGSSEVNEQSVPEYTASVLHKLGRAFELTREHLQRTAISMYTWYNRKIRPKSFIPGDKVHVYNPRRMRGRYPKWQSFCHDVATVERRLNDVTYVVNSSSWRQAKIVHVDKLKPARKFNELS
jgi:hypothetical protein